MSNGGQAAGDGRTISIRGHKYKKGLGVHAYSSVNYALRGVCSQFVADIGIDDETNSRGTVQFIIYSDGQNVYQSNRLTGRSGIVHVNLPLNHPQYLELRVLDGGDGNASDHADWANARVSCSSALPTQ
jgi:hypothetical protein